MKIDDRFIKPPIIIGGCGRSGTSLLLSVLAARPTIFAIPFETEAFCPTAYSRAVNLNATFELDRIRQILADKTVANEVTRWCEKTPKNILFFERILKTFGGDVRLINIVRDGRDVVTSRHPKSPDTYYVKSERWITDVAAGLPFDTHPQVLVIRYEDLVVKFEEVITELYEFLEEPLDDRVLDWHKHTTVRTHTAWKSDAKELHSQSLGKWRLPEHRQAVSAIMSEPGAVRLLKHYGYLPASAAPVGAWEPRALIRRAKRRVPRRFKESMRRLLKWR